MTVTYEEALQKYEGEDITALVIQQPNFFGQNGKLAGQQRTDAERSRGVRDAGFPISGIGPKLTKGIGYLKFEVRDARLGLLPVSRHERSDQIDLAREMMVNARLANADRLGDIGGAEPVIAACHDQRTRAGEDLVGGTG